MSETRQANAGRWRQRIADQRCSGLSIAAFCRRHGLSHNSFYLWRRRLRHSATPFVELQTPVESVAGIGVIDVCLRGRRRLRVHRGFDRGLLIDLVRVLEGIA